MHQVKVPTKRRGWEVNSPSPGQQCWLVYMGCTGLPGIDPNFHCHHLPICLEVRPLS